jgi:3-oxoacyl-[acyl-carrier protein] reductase
MIIISPCCSSAFPHGPYPGNATAIAEQSQEQIPDRWWYCPFFLYLQWRTGETTMTLKDRHALVTGASRGIGRAIAEAFAQSGARVAVHYHTNEKAARETFAALPGGPHLLVRADLADPDAVRIMTESVVADFGTIEILVNNAGIYELYPITNPGYDAWRAAWQRTVDLNLTGAVHTSFCVVQHMIRNGGGRIINISSRGAFRGEPQAPAYGASKAALNAFGQSLAVALGPHNISVFTVAPGWVETDLAAPFLADAHVLQQSPLRRAARPEEIARTVLFLAVDETGYLTGSIIDANGASYLRS